MTSTPQGCGLSNVTLCLDDPNFTSEFWTSTLFQGTGQCIEAGTTGDYTVTYQIPNGNGNSIPGSCTTFIDTGIMLDIQTSNPNNTTFSCATNLYSGSFTAIVTGGSGFYNYAWNGGGSLATMTFNTSNPYEIFTLTVTDLINNATCTTDLSFNLEYFACIYDLNGDGIVGIADLITLTSQYGCTSNCGAADFDCDGIVGAQDLLNFTGAFGTSCS